MPRVASSTIAELQRRGVSMVAEDAPLCAGDVRLSFGPAEVVSDGVYQIEVDVAWMGKDGIGDIDYLRYRLDCRTGSCAAVDKLYMAHDEIGGSC
jgi:hypothetical protein